MKKYLKKNKLKVIFFSIIIAIGILLILMLYPLYGGKIGSNYGKRLEGINDVKISNNKKEDIVKNIKENLKTKDVKVSLKGKIINIEIYLDDEVIDTATEYIPSVFDILNKKQIDFYDIQVFLVKDNINIIGYKSKTSSTIIWTNNR